MSHLPPNTLYEDRFVIREVIGEGGFATVYRARWGDRDVAIKLLRRPKGGYPPDVAQRFEREVAILRALRSPRIVQVLDAGRDRDGRLFLVTEYVAGEDLSELLDRRGRLTPDDVRVLLVQLLEALHETHTKGLVHRDIKPANIRVTNPGPPIQVKLLDFGIARMAGDEPSDKITATNELVGTFRYMSPEQLTNESLTAASDIYSLGVVAIELLTGSHALPGNSLPEQLDRLRSGHLLAPDSQNRHEIWGVLDRMTARRPEERYATARAVLAALNPRALTTQRSPAPPRRNVRNLTYLLVAAAVVVAVLGIGLFGGGGDSDPPVRRPATQVPVVSPTLIATEPSLDLGAPGSVVDVGPDTSRDVRSDAAVYVPQPSVGCGDGAPEMKRPGHLKVDTSTGGTAEPLPLVILLHDHLVDPSDVYGGEGLWPDRPVIVAAPQDFSPKKVSKADRRRLPWGDREKDKPLIREAFDFASSTHCVDLNRVFVIAHGAGGLGANTVACEPWITAIGYFGARLNREKGRAKPPSCGDRLRPAIWMHATNSVLLPADGKINCKNWPFSSLEVAREFNRERFSCSGEPRPWPTELGATCEELSCAKPYVFCAVRGGTMWPGLQRGALHLGTDGLDCMAETSPRYPVAHEMWRFFDQVSAL